VSHVVISATLVHQTDADAAEIPIVQQQHLTGLDCRM
jgi:hypothetical protein